MRILRHFFLYLLLFLVLQGCSQRARLQQVKDEWLEWQTELQPQFPTWPEYLSSVQLQEYETFLEEAIQRVQTISTSPASKEWEPAIDSLKSQLVAEQLRMQARHQDPSLYNLPTRWQEALEDKQGTYTTLLPQLVEAPVYYATIRQLLTNPESHRCQKAIEEHIEGLSVLTQLSLKIERSDLDAASKTSLQLALSQAKIAIKDYIGWCNSQAIESFETN